MKDAALRKFYPTFHLNVTLPINDSVLCRLGHKQWIHERIKVHRANKECFTNCEVKFSLVFCSDLLYLNSDILHIVSFKCTFRRL